MMYKLVDYRKESQALELSKNDKMYLDIAQIVSERSRDRLYKVGALVAKGNNILSYGWNGTPHGMDNDTRNHDGTTKWEVIHAETNAIAKLAASTSSSEGATLYVTVAPCSDCTLLVMQAGIKRVVYKWPYLKEVDGVRVTQNYALDLLRDNGVEVAQYRD
jgi:dCMP deaminase